MKEKIRYFIAGIFIGLSELLPGISGATVALMFGVYEKILNFLSKFKELNLIAPLLLGMLLSVLVFSSLIDFLYKNHAYVFNIFIALLMIGYGLFLLINTYLNEDINKLVETSIGKTFKRKSSYINLFLAVFFIGFYVGLYLSSIQTDGYQEPNISILILFGFCACSFLLFPGISGSAFLLSVGAYPLIIGSISNFNFEVLLPFGIGMLGALILMPRLINKAYEKFGKLILVFFGGLVLAAGVNYFL
jgi:putative membrane protein